MSRPISTIIGLLMLLAMVGLVVWLLVRSVRNSDDPPKLVLKWFLSLVFGGLLLAFVKTVGFEGCGALAIPFACVAFGVAMSVVWAPSIGAFLAKPITSMFDGGDEEIEPQPFYSIALARRKSGKYLEAVAEVQKQLARFPQDSTGLMLLAELRAENLNDLPGAELAIQRLCEQPGHAPKTLALALNRLADWQVKYGQDLEAARRTLEKIIGLFPDSEDAQFAAQRRSHLGSTDNLLAGFDRRTIHLPTGEQNVGLLKDSSTLQSPSEDLAAKAVAYVKHLEQFPADNEARENLALLYAEHFQRPDLAAMQLEHLIQQPSQAAKQMIRWLNLLADLQIQYAQNYEAARQALQRIIDLYPGLAPADIARQRINHLKLELKGKEKSQVVQLGSYEQDLGLKKR